MNRITTLRDLFSDLVHTDDPQINNDALDVLFEVFDYYNQIKQLDEFRSLVLMMENMHLSGKNITTLYRNIAHEDVVNFTLTICTLKKERFDFEGQNVNKNYILEFDEYDEIEMIQRGLRRQIERVADVEEFYGIPHRRPSDFSPN